MSGLKTIPLQKKIPKYGHYITDNIINLDDGKFMATMKLGGIPFESESSRSLEAAFLNVKNLFNQMAKKHGGKLAVWTHIIKNKDHLDDSYLFPNNKFMQDLSDKYIRSFSGQDFFSTNYYISLIFKYHVEDFDKSLLEFEELLNSTASTLKRFDCHILGISNNGTSCKTVEFLSHLINRNHRRIPLVENKVQDIIGDSDWHFGYDLLEIRNSESQTSKYGIFYELDALPTVIDYGLLDFVLSQQCEFVITQSIILFKVPDSLKIIDDQINEVISTNANPHELNELSIAKDAISGGTISFGDYHLSIGVFSDNQEELIKNATDFSGQFGARSIMLKRSNLKSSFSFLSSLPGSTERITPSPRTCTVLACTFSMHNYSKGKKSGNPIGDGSALIPLKSMSDTIFYLNCHASEPEKDVRGKKYAGHTMILGASGTGKTTLEGMIVGFSTRFNPQVFAIDYNRSTELFIRAYGGEYFTFSEGEDSGLNPFQLEDTPSLRSFLNRLCNRLGSDKDGHITEKDEQEIKLGIDSVMRLSIQNRGLSALLSNIQQPHLRARFSKWCRSESGQFAWCLDSPENRFNPAEMDKVGFDTTLLLESMGGEKGHPACEVVLATLFYMKELMQKNGRLLITVVEEFWMPANFPLTQDLMKKVLKAGRLKGEFMILSSQSPEDAINCEIFPAIIQQTATKIFLPNPDAEYSSYEKCNITESEFGKLTVLEKTSRTFLIKQSNISCFAKLNLLGYDDYLPFISGTTEDIIICDKIRKKHGDNPDIWIPLVRKEINNRKQEIIE